MCQYGRGHKQRRISVRIKIKISILKCKTFKRTVGAFNYKNKLHFQCFFINDDDVHKYTIHSIVIIDMEK